jgi:hypothetical protein
MLLLVTSKKIDGRKYRIGINILGIDEGKPHIYALYYYKDQ